MPLVTLAEESKVQDGFYVPQFELRIENVGLPRDVLRDVLQLTYRDNMKEIDGFEITVNNWDPTTRDFKYVGAETPASLKSSTDEGLRQRLFEPYGKEVIVRMGYLNKLQFMMKGQFTTMAPSFPSGGAPTLTVTGLNVLHKLRKKPYTYAWTPGPGKESGWKDSEIAENLATLTDPQKPNDQRFPATIVTDPNAKSREQPLEYVAQENMPDLDFLLWRARLRGYVIVVQERDPNARGSKPQLYFGPSQGTGLRDVTVELEWGKSLIDFTPTLTTANQVRSVTVQGWNRRTKQPISRTATLEDPRFTQNRDLQEFLTKGDPRDEIVVNKPVFTEDEADALAFAILSDRQKVIVKATGTTVGLPDLRAGRQVVIKGLGARFSGTYFLTETTHTIGAGGYTTRFGARREDPGGGKTS